MAYSGRIPFMTGEEIFVSFLFYYHYIFAFYTIAVNSLYLILVILSWITLGRQHTSWSIADKHLLFLPGVLPSITILAPAFNEEKNIIQNVYSLLSLEYPDLELIVINDGSRDQTAERLIEHFELELADYTNTGSIQTSPLIGVYRNQKIPNLILIDKQNGGKADSLNAGLNVATGEYVCSIDADSLLEPSALTNLMLRTIISRKKTVAIGGNIIPVNGSKVSSGSVVEIHLPGNRFAKYQTIEYLRSFMAGRLGWTMINSLLIISGAFGAFERRFVQDMGGYMTGKGSLKKDTVGEDMELVVRLIRHLCDSGIPHKIDYAYNASCWTEVPEDLNGLVKQRDRWQRGLIEIMIYHKKMLLNRKYGPAGMIGFPYYFIVELMGPFLEFLGYVVLLLTLIFGLLSSHVFLFMFSIVVLYGILISVMALFLAEKQVLYFKGKEFVSGIWVSFAENFGFRQFMSLIRPFSYIAYLFRNKGWQKLERKGFIQ